MTPNTSVHRSSFAVYAGGPFGAALRPHQPPPRDGAGDATGPAQRVVPPPSWTEGLYVTDNAPAFAIPAGDTQRHARIDALLRKAAAQHHLSVIEQVLEVHCMCADHKYAFWKLFKKLPPGDIRQCRSLEGVVDEVMRRLNARHGTRYPMTAELLDELREEQAEQRAAPAPRGPRVNLMHPVVAPLAGIAIGLLYSLLSLAAQRQPSSLAAGCRDITPTPPYPNRYCFGDNLAIALGQKPPHTADLSHVPGIVFGGTGGSLALRPNTLYIYSIAADTGEPVLCPKAMADAHHIKHTHLARGSDVIVTGMLHTDEDGSIGTLSNAGGHHQTGGPYYLDPVLCEYVLRPPVPDVLEQAREILTRAGFAVAPDVRLRPIPMNPGSPDFEANIVSCQQELSLRNRYS